MSKNTVSTSIVTNGKAKTALEKLAALKAQMAELEKQANDELNAQRAKVDAKILELPKFLGVEDLPTALRAIATYAKHGTAYPAGKSVGETGPRKERVTLTDEQKKAVIDELKALQTAKPGIIAHCRTIEARPGMPGFQTIYGWAGEAGLTTKRAETVAAAAK